MVVTHRGKTSLQRLGIALAHGTQQHRSRIFASPDPLISYLPCQIPIHPLPYVIISLSFETLLSKD